MKRTLLVLFAVLCSCAQQRIGQLSSRDHANAGRPREAYAAVVRENPSSPYRPFHEGMFLHSAGAFDKSEEAWSRIRNAETLLHPTELAALKRLRALNAAALTQDAARLIEALDGSTFELKQVSSSEAELIVVIEQGWAPTPYASSDQSGQTVVGVTTYDVKDDVVVRLDQQQPLKPSPVIDDGSTWSSATLERFERMRSPPADLIEALDPAKRMQNWKLASDVWWSAPTRLAIARIVTTPGVHVLLLPTPNGLRERRVELVAGRPFIVVTRS